MKIYKQWKQELGTPIEVEKIEFIDYVRKNNKIYTFVTLGVKYLGEIWLVEDNNGQQFEAKIKIEYNEDLFNNKKKEPLPAHLVDTWVNPIVDPPEIVHSYLENKPFNRNKISNFLLDEVTEERKGFIEKLQKLKKVVKKEENKGFYNYLKVKLRFEKSPNYMDFKFLKREQDKYIPLINQI